MTPAKPLRVDGDGNRAIGGQQADAAAVHAHGGQRVGEGINDVEDGQRRFGLKGGVPVMGGVAGDGDAGRPSRLRPLQGATHLRKRLDPRPRFSTMQSDMYDLGLRQGR